MLGSFDGIAIADYWLVRKRRLDLAQLYTPEGIYSYVKGVNVRAVIALVIGWAVALTGLAVPALRFLWNGGWIFSLLGGLLAYWLLMRGERSTISEHEFEHITRNAGTPEEPAPGLVASEARS
jgi:NCS1 family nucleobase:cation symporter-1